MGKCMKKNACKKFAGLISFFAFLILFSACGGDAKQVEINYQYASFRDIPGITEAEIDAIE